ncbi:hypothetical protein B0H16DRAFT_1536461, partial [Mycena metata]
MLARLPMRDLLVAAPRVNKMWNAITLTPTLQRALFFQSYSSDSPPMQNPLLMELFPPFFAPEGPHGPWFWPGDTESITKMPWASAPEAFRRPDASWRRMLVVQPSAPTLVVTETCHSQQGNFQRRATVDYNDPPSHGLRMGALYDLVVVLLNSTADLFCIRWPGYDGVNLEDDLRLSVFYTRQCSGRRAGRRLDGRFRSDVPAAAAPKFGKSVRLQWVESDDSEEE